MKINVLPFIVFHYLLYSQHMDRLNNVVKVINVFQGTSMKGKLFPSRSIHHRLMDEEKLSLW